MSTRTLTVGPNPALAIENVGGDLVIEGWERTELEARGDDLHQLEQNGSAIHISCGGDLNLSVPRGSSLNLNFVGGDVRLENLDGSIAISFVGGDAQLRNLMGPVSLAGVIGGDTQMENVSKISMEAHRSGIGSDISAKVRRKVEEATRRAERKTREAEQKARHVEFKVRDAERKMSHAGHGLHSMKANLDLGRWKWNMAPGSFPSGGAGDSASDEERMAILKMLQDKKITAEDAEKLLAALEGGA
jgi:hypothetical protein